MQKLLEIQKKLLKFKKEGKANYGKYITLDDLLDKLLPVCNEIDLLVYHSMVDGKIITTVSDGKTTLTSEFPIINLSSPQKIGASITYAKRYNIGQLFNIVTDDDTDDGNKTKENHQPIPPKERVKFETKHYDNFVKEYKKHITRYPTADSMIKMLDVQYILSDEYKNKIIEFYKTI